MMKIKILPLMFTLLVLTVASASAQESDVFKPGGKIYGLFFTNFHTTFEGGSNSSAFEVTRSYLGFEYRFSEGISTRILYDGTTSVIDGKTLYTGYLRNAFIQYNKGSFILQGGLIGMEQVSAMEKIWAYRFISKPPIDYSGMVQVADLGVSTKFSAVKWLSVDLSVTQGRGVKNLVADGTYKLSAGFTMTPATNMIIRGFFDMMGPTGSMQRTASITAAYTGPRLTAGAEYLRQDNNKMTPGNDYSGVSFFTRVPLAEKVNLFARYDRISSTIPEGETDPWNITKDGAYLFAGIDFSPARNIRISPNFIGYIPSDSGSDMTSTIGLNIEARF
jgi:hypothetical protein